jgi:hypothetical protein
MTMIEEQLSTKGNGICVHIFFPSVSFVSSVSRLILQIFQWLALTAFVAFLISGLDYSAINLAIESQSAESGLCVVKSKDLLLCLSLHFKRTSCLLLHAWSCAKNSISLQEMHQQSW